MIVQILDFGVRNARYLFWIFQNLVVLFGQITYLLWTFFFLFVKCQWFHSIYLRVAYNDWVTYTSDLISGHPVQQILAIFINILSINQQAWWVSIHVATHGSTVQIASVQDLTMVRHLLVAEAARGRISVSSAVWICRFFSSTSTLWIWSWRCTIWVTCTAVRLGVARWVAWACPSTEALISSGQ